MAGSWEGAVLPQLTRLEVNDCTVQVDQVAAVEEEDELAAWAGAPLLHAAAPRLAALDLGYSGCEDAAALLDCRLTALTHVHLPAKIFGYEGEADGAEDTGYAFRKVERLAPASLGIQLSSVHLPDLADDVLAAAMVGRVRPALAWLYDCAVGLSARGALQSLAIRLAVVPVPVHMLLPALAPLGGSLRELELLGCVLGASEDCALALRCLPMFTRLEVLTIKLTTYGLPLQQMLGLTDAALRALAGPLPALRAHAPALRRVSVQLPKKWSEGVSRLVIEELHDACPGLLSIEYGTHC